MPRADLRQLHEFDRAPHWPSDFVQGMKETRQAIDELPTSLRVMHSLDHLRPRAVKPVNMMQVRSGAGPERSNP
jgi:hypothetical protein